MKVFIILTTYLTVTLASGNHQQYPVPHEDIRYDGRFGYAHLKIGHNGVPINTPEVQYARDAHLSLVAKAIQDHAKRQAKSSHGPLADINQARTHAVWDGNNEAKSSQSPWAGNDVSNGAHGEQYGSSNLNYLNPLNNIEVVYLNTYSQDKVSQSDWAPQSNDHQRRRRGINEGHSNRRHQEEQIPYSYAEIGPNGLPLDTPEVQALKQAHLAAHSAALAFIEKHRKSHIWANDQYDNGAWKDDTNEWRDVETSTTKVWNSVGRRNKGYSNNNGWDNQGYGNNELKNVQPATSHSKQNLESGPHTKISVKSKGWSNVRHNNGWNNEAYNNKNDWNNEAYNNNVWNNGASNNKAWNNVAHNSNAWKNTEPAISNNNQRLESGPHTKVTWQNNPWSDEDNSAGKSIESTTAHNNQNLRSNEHSNKDLNTSGSNGKYSAYKGPYHIPKIHNGVPEYTPEVKLAREQHLAALAEALAKAPVYKSPQHEYHH